MSIWVVFDNTFTVSVALPILLFGAFRVFRGKNLSPQRLAKLKGGAGYSTRFRRFNFGRMFKTLRRGNIPRRAFAGNHSGRTCAACIPF